MQSLLNELVELEQSLRSTANSGPADFFASLSQRLKSENKDLIREALNLLGGSAPIVQYGGFTSQQEAIHGRIAEKALQLRDLA